MYPYDEAEPESAVHEQQHGLQRLVEDPLYWREQDPEFRAYVDNGFKAVYGTEGAERDATGRMVEPEPKPVTLPPFKPSVTAEDVNLAGGVGENQPNRWRNVWNVQKGLANTGHYALDLTKEKSGERSPALDQAIRDFQREKREEIDGTLLPGGPTITRMKESLLGENRARPTAPPVPALPFDSSLASDDTGDSVELASYRSKQRPPRPPMPDRRDPTARGIQWLLEQWRKLPNKPSPRMPKGMPGDVDETPQPKRAVIFTMPGGDAYILRRLQPPELRNPGSEFALSEATEEEPQKARHFDYEKDDRAREYNQERLPLTLDEARRVQQRVANGDESVNRDDRMRAERRLVQGRQALIIRYPDRDDGTPDMYQAQHKKTGQFLWVPGDQPMIISADEALALGLIDWIPFVPSRMNFPEVFDRENWKRFRNMPPADGKDRVR